MARTKTKSKLVEVDFNSPQMLSKLADFSCTFEDGTLKSYGIPANTVLYFKEVVEFSDGDFIAVQFKDGYRFGFAYALTNAILIGTFSYFPLPKREVKRIGILVNHLDLNRDGTAK